ncbi:MAG: GmrSD restriction endonuclease domain-containing protein [Clostridium sp.]|uniref:GmrSD restriction endonuclease domain-containing protein n=1 Tax=Clostridium sp. TaxID=1506 RepID=UPI003EE64628
MSQCNRQNTESIVQIIGKIDNKLLVLPDFQRDFVWDESKTYELFDSLVRDIFIGSIIYGVPSFEIAVREIDTRMRKIKGKRRQPLKTIIYSEKEIKEKVKVDGLRAVLDGQQRITSIYRALKNIDNVWFIAKESDEIDEFDEFNNMFLEDIMFSFAGKEDNTRLSIKIGDIFEFMGKGLREKSIKKIYFDKLEFIKSIDDEEEKDDYFDKFLIISQKIQDLFKAEKMLSYFLLDMSSDKFALFFERSNTLGVRLDFIDILVAKLNSGFRLRNKIGELENKSQFTVEREILVRNIAFIISEYKNIDKGYILSKLKAQHFIENWDNISKLYVDTVEFLDKNNFITTQEWIPHTNMLIPIIQFLNHLPSKSFSQMNQNQIEFLKYWYWMSIFAQRYTGGATNEVIIKDCNILIRIAKNKKISNINYFRSLKSVIEQPEDLYSFNKKGSALYKGVLTFINFIARGLTDWQNNSKISFVQKVDDHHIIPKSYLQEKISEENIELIDCVVNRTLIPKITNIKIGKKSPDVYMKELYQINNMFEKSLQNHLIPLEVMNGTYNEFFDGFIKKRAELIFCNLKNIIIDKRDEIIKLFYEEPKKNYMKTINIFSDYKKERIDASFNRETGEVLWNGEKYSSVSIAAKAVRRKKSNKDSYTNGWIFWKYKDGEEEKYVKELKNIK